MRVQNISVDRVGDASRLSAEVVFETSLLGTKNVFYEIPAQYESMWDKSGYSFYGASLLLAMKYKEAIHIETPITSEIALKLDILQKTFASWYPNEFSVVPVEWTPAEECAVSRKRKRAIFFSSGVDSLHTVFRVKNFKEYAYPDDEIFLLPVVGMDFRPERADLVSALHHYTTDVTRWYNWKSLPVCTNVHWDLLSEDHVSWGSAAHVAALASVANALANGFDCVYLGSSGHVNRLTPWGSTLTLDHLWATGTLELFHVGSECERLDKIREMSASPELVKNIRCCYYSETSNPPNCGYCEKCLRTLCALEAINQRHLVSDSFPPIGYEKLCSLVAKTEIPLRLLHDWGTIGTALEEAQEKTKLAEAVRHALKMAPRMSFEKRVTKFFHKILPLFPTRIRRMLRKCLLWVRKRFKGYGGF